MLCQERGGCVIRDDVAVLEAAVRNADLLILASPTHWGNLSAPMLRAFERLFGYLIQEQPRGFPKKRNAAGKKAILVSSCSTPYPFNWIFNQTRAVFGRFHEICTYSGIKVVGELPIPGTLTMRSLPPQFLARARAIGRKLSD